MSHFTEDFWARAEHALRLLEATPELGQIVSAEVDAFYASHPVQRSKMGEAFIASLVIDRRGLAARTASVPQPTTETQAA